MHDHAGGLPVAIDNIDHLQRQLGQVERDALDPTGLFAAEQHRFAVLEPELAIFGTLGSGEIVEPVLVIDDAVLEDFHEGRALVGIGGLEHVRQVLRHVEPAGDEAGTGTQGKSAGQRGPVDRAQRRGRAVGAFTAGRRVLAFGQAVDLVVEQQHLAVQVAAQQVHRVVAADAHPIAVAGDQPDIQFRIGQLDAGRHGRGAAVDGVEAIAFDVVGETAGAADARNEHRLGRVRAQFRQGTLHRLEDRIVAAARAPTDFLVRFPVLERGGDRRNRVHRIKPCCFAETGGRGEANRRRVRIPGWEAGSCRPEARCPRHCPVRRRNRSQSRPRSRQW